MGTSRRSKEKEENVRTAGWGREMHPKAKLTSKGQVTIPLAIREALGLSTGAQLSFELSGGELLVRPISNKTWADLWNIASGAPKPASTVNVSAAVQAAVRDRFDR